MNFFTHVLEFIAYLLMSYPFNLLVGMAFLLVALLIIYKIIF